MKAKKPALLVLTLIFALVLCGVASAANTPLNTTHNGTVSGDLYVNATQPVPFANQPTDATSREFNQTYNLPDNTGLDWARVYVNVYSGSGSANWPANVTVKLDGNGDSIYETILGNELMTSDQYSIDGTIYWINDHCFRVYSDYQAWYDVTGLITCTNPSIYVKTEQVGTATFDGRLKMIALVAAYNDGDDDRVHYWVNDGQDWINTGSSQTTFKTSNVTLGVLNATLNAVGLSSKDGSYNFNGQPFNGTDPVAPVNYFETHTWNVTGNVTPGQDSTLTYTLGSGSYKIVLSTLTVSEELPILVPVANFTANTTAGVGPLNVQFNDTSLNRPTSWLWDFNSDGIVDSTERNPSYTYTNVGKYNVTLTTGNTVGNNTIVRSGLIEVYPTGNGLANSTWPKFQGNNNNTGQSPYNGPEDSVVIWAHTTGSSIQYAGPSIGTYGTIYIGSRDCNIYALNPDGTVRWKFTAGNQIQSTPTIATDGTIYFGSIDGKLYALNPDGTVKWTYTTGGALYSSPAIGPAGTLYVGSYDKNLYAINPDGTLQWTYTTGNYIYNYGGTPAIDSNGTIYVGSYDSKLYALNPDGTLKWTYITGNRIYGAPSIGPDGTIYVGSYDKKFYALNPDGTLKWNYTTGGYIYGTPAFATDGTVYIGSRDSKLYALNPDGTLKWNYTTGGAIYGTPVVDVDGTIYFGSYDDKVYALNPDGTLKWSYTTGGDISGAPAIGSDGSLYVGSYDGKLYAFKVVPVEANFTSDVDSGTAPLTVKFTDQSKYATSWAWDFNGDGIIDSTAQNPTYTYAFSTPGNYTVTLTAYNVLGNSTINSSIQLAVVPPVANFTSDQKIGYAPLYVRFKDQSKFVTSWAWDFNGDGIVDSTEQNPLYIYNTSGKYSVKLTATGPGGSSSITKTSYVTVNGWKPEDFKYKYRAYVAGSTTDLTDYQVKLVIHNTTGTNSGANIYLPNISQSNYNDIRFALADGTQLNYWMETPVGSNGTVFWVKVPFIPQGNNTPVAIDIYYGNSTIGSATNGEATFLLFDDFDGTTLDTSKWQVTSGTPILNDSNFILNSANLQSYLQFTNNAALCLYGNLWYSGAYIGFGTGSSFVNTAVIRATSSIAELWVSTPSSGSSGAGTSMVNDYQRMEMKWTNSKVSLKVGDNTEKTHSKIPYDTLPLTLRAGSYNPLAWLYIRQLVDIEPTIYPVLIADFISDKLTGDAPLTVKFTDLSAGEIDSWAWDFNDDGTIDSTEQNPTYTYQAPGNYNVNLIVSKGNSSDTVSKTEYLIVNPATLPVADFSVDKTSGDAPLTVQFTDLSTGSIPMTWAWDFNGDGVVDSTEQNPTYTYNTHGNYTVSLTVTNAAGNSTKTMTNITVIAPDPPVADFSADKTSGDAALTVNFTDQSNGAIASWAWDFNGDGIIDSTEQNPTYTYNTHGNYTVTLTVANIMGTSTKTENITATNGIDLIVNSVSPSIYIHDKIAVTITNNGTEDAPVSMATIVVDGASTTVNVPALAAGNSTTLIIPDPVYRSAGDIVPITVTVDPENLVTEKDEDNNVNNTSATAIVTGQAWNGGRYYNGTDMQTSYYTEGHVGIAISNGGTGYGWFAYNTPGTGTVTFTPESLNIPDGATIQSARLHQAWTWYGYPGYSVQFNGQNITEIAQYIDAGDGLNVYDVTAYFNSASNNTAIITSPGGASYATLLIVVYEHINEPYRQIWINEGFDVIYYAPATGYAMFNNVSVNNVASAEVNTITGSGGGDCPTILFNGETIDIISEGGSDPNYNFYNVLGALINGANELGVYGGSYFSLNTAILTLTMEPVEADFTANNTTVDAGSPVQFTDNSTGATGWSWDFNNDGVVDSTEQNPTWTYNTSGNYTVKLVVTGPNGSNEEVKGDYITVNVPPAPVAGFTANITGGNEPLTVQFTDNSSGATGWSWDFNNDGVVDSTEQNPTWTYNTSGNYTVKLAVTGPGGSSQEIKTDYIFVNSTDTTAPTVNCNLQGKVFRNSQTVTLTASDDQCTNPKIYYTLNGEEPTINSTLYTGSISINSTTTLKFMAVDDVGNISPVQIEIYTIDNLAPVASVSLKGGLYNANKSIILTALDNVDTQPRIYYTLNGITPTSSSTLYTGPISINSTTMLKFIAVDNLGNTSPAQTEIYTIDTTKPTVTGVNPANNKVINVANKVLVITFSENIKAGSAFTSIKVTNPDGVSVKPLYKVINGKTLTLTRNGYYINGLTYTITLPTGSITDTAGNTLKTAFTSKFTVDFAKPTITTVNPANNKVINVANKALVITFSENIKAGSAFTSIKVTNPDGVSVKPLYKVINGKTLTLTRNGYYINGLTYTITLPTGSITDTAGNTLKTAFTSKFKIDTTKPTITRVNPKNNSSGFSLTAPITITFNENILEGVNWSKITMKNLNTGKTVSFTKSRNGKTLTIKMISSRLHKNTYQIYIPAETVKDNAGNKQNTPYTLTFKTQ